MFKRIFLLPIFLFNTTLIFSQTQTTVTGTIQGPTGVPATSGYVEFRIRPASSSIAYRVSGTAILAPQISRCNINSSGNVVALAGGPCKVWGNTTITPANTSYDTVIAPANVVSSTIQQQLISGTTYDLSSPVFAPNVALVPQYQTITTAPVNANITPGADKVFSLGSSSRYFSEGYVDNLFTNNLNAVINSITARNINSIRYANRFDGADAGAKIVAGITDLPTTGGTIDARGLEGPQTISQDVLAGITKPVRIILGHSTYTVSVSQTIRDGQSWEGQPTIERWRSSANCGTIISYTGGTAAFNITPGAGNGRDSIELRNLCLNGSSAAASTDGIRLDADAGGGDYIEGILFENMTIQNFPRHQVFALRTVFDVTFRRVTIQNPDRTADNLVQYEYDNVAGAASQWTFDDCWLVPYTTGKWAFFAGRKTGNGTGGFSLANNAISDVRFVNGTVAPYDNVDNVANGANGIWVYGGLTVIGTHIEGVPYNQPRTVGIRYTGGNGAFLAPSQVTFLGTGIELGNAGTELGGSARLSDESMNVHIPAGVSFNNNICTLAGGAAVNCADIRVVQTGNRRGTFIQSSSNITTNNTYFGTADGPPRLIVEPAFSTTTCTNATPIVCTTSAAHGWSAGQSVYVTGVTGNTAANGYWRVSAVTATTATLEGSAGSGAPTANTGVISPTSNDVLFWNWSTVSGGVSQLGPLRFDHVNRRIGINTSPSVAFETRSQNNNGMRLSNSSNSNRIAAQILASGGDIGQFLGYDASEVNKTVINGDGTSAFSTTGAALADASAITTLTSTTKGFLPPRMTTAQRDAIGSPASGLLIYNTTTGFLNYYNGSWIQVNGVTGTVSVRDAGGAGDCDLVFTNGLFVSTTC